MHKVAVIGACGHVGLPFAIINALQGNHVVGYDINQSMVDQCMSGAFPYFEVNGQDALSKALTKGLAFTTDKKRLQECNVIAIMIGTPVDEENNPRIKDILDFVDNVLAEYLRNIPWNIRPMILLRSTVAPGTTDLIRDRLVAKGFGNFTLAFCPERVAQGYSLEETMELPQLIGAYSQEDFDNIAAYFATINNKEPQFLSPREAEIAKLITNMTRYVNFALANEFYIIGDKQGVDIHKVIDAANFEYPRLSLPKPGPNVGGPCLFKDGRFLLEDIPFVELIQTSFIINEGMPQYIFNRMMEANPDIKKVQIRGMTFKADNDDTRNSLSFKFKKICERHGLEVQWTDPFLGDSDILTAADAYVIMTPHTEYRNIFEEFKDLIPKGTVLVDVWKIGGDITKNSLNGIVRI